MSKKQLTPKQQAFVNEYLIDLNATQAAIRAGYSKKTAGSQGQRLLMNVEIQAALSKAQDKRAERAEINADYVLNRLVEIDQMDVLDILCEDGSLKPVSDWPKVWRTYISGIDLSELYESNGNERVLMGMLKKIKWPDKVKNLELLGKHVTVGAFKERVAVGGDPDAPPLESIVMSRSEYQKARAEMLDDDDC